MKKWMIKIFLWDHFCQVLFLVGAIPGIILWIRGKAALINTFWVGFDIAGAFFWQFYLEANKRTDYWTAETLKQLEERKRLLASMYPGETSRGN